MHIKPQSFYVYVFPTHHTYIYCCFVHGAPLDLCHWSQACSSTSCFPLLFRTFWKKWTTLTAWPWPGLSDFGSGTINCPFYCLGNKNIIWKKWTTLMARSLEHDMVCWTRIWRCNYLLIFVWLTVLSWTHNLNFISTHGGVKINRQTFLAQ